MTWATRFRLARWWRASLVAVPLTWTAGALVCAFGVPWWDGRDPLVAIVSTDVDSARDQLSSIASGMMAFTGVVFAALVLVIQFGSQTYSPRLLRWLRRDVVVKHALGSFIACFVYSVLALGQLGRGDPDFTPTRTVLVAFGLLLVAVVLFLALVGRTTNNLRLATVLQDIDVIARRSIDAVYPVRLAHRPAVGPPVPSDDDVVQEVRHEGPSAVVVAIDRSALARLGREAAGIMELVPQLGEYVGAGRLIVRVHGGHPVDPDAVRAAIVTGDERTADDDPAFCLRLLVDIGIRALSPAVNDPTTAVQVIDRVEDLLFYAGERDLSIGQVRDRGGVLRCLYPTPTWDSLVELAVSELRRYGNGSVQVPRRLAAMLDRLGERLPAERQEALTRQRDLLADWTAGDAPGRDNREIVVPDRLGIGGVRRTAPRPARPQSEPSETPRTKNR